MSRLELQDDAWPIWKLALLVAGFFAVIYVAIWTVTGDRPVSSAPDAGCVSYGGRSDCL